jgi:ATP-dependent helicase/nuclease subunit B
VAEVSVNLRRHFLTWHSPLPKQAVAWLARDWDRRGPLDLSHLLVVVPTRQAGRRLRAGLAELADAHATAVFPPRVVTPEKLIVPAAELNAATPLQVTLAWIHVLQGAALDNFRAVFPLDPPARNFTWARRFAREFVQLQSTLAEVGLLIDDVPARLPAGFPERERWQQLAVLARHHRDTLAERGWGEPQGARIATARAPAPLAGFERIVVLAIPDPLPLALDALEQHAKKLPIEVVVHAPEGEAANFDAWGRSITASWAGRAAPFASFRDEVHLLPDATAQAERIAAIAARYPAPDGILGIAVADPAITPLAENALQRGGRAAFDPSGEVHGAHGLFQCLAVLAAFAREPATFAQTVAVARSPEVIDWLTRELGPSFGAAEWLAALDNLQRKHLPATLADARTRASGLAASGLTLLADLRTEMRSTDFTSGAIAVATRLFRGRQLDLSRPQDRRFAESAEAWTDVMRACGEAARFFAEVQREDWWEIALEEFGRGRREVEKPAGALELQGWLELPWEDAAHVIVAGFNDGRVPESVTGEVFLPESLRSRLGLKTNDDRLARDSYLLHALVASRRADGRVDILLGKASSAGDPLKPSRLLLQCADDELPARVRHLFRQLTSAAVLPAWERPWKLRPRRVALTGPLSPTAFRTYLSCPFRFYLQHVLRLEAVDAEKSELDVFDFGRLCHKPLEILVQPAWQDCADEEVLAAAFVEDLDRRAREAFGPTPAVPLVAQLESARQRLRRAAKVQAQQRRDGWQVFAIEREFRIEVAGMEVKGRIDRIDRHESGAWRLIDYKTSDTPKNPLETHLGPPREGVLDWMIWNGGDKPRQWFDLQLPLYLKALPQLVPEASGRTVCGYFNLPKAVASTSVAVWESYPLELQESAMRCAEGVVDAVRRGEFWPPNDNIRPDNDSFAELFHRGALDSVEWGNPEAVPAAQTPSEEAKP